MNRSEARAAFTTAAYLRAKSVWGGAFRGSKRHAANQTASRSTPFSAGRDPKPLSAVLASAAEDMGWSIELDQAAVITAWPELVGEVTAPHTRVVELREGILIVQCDSTAWATELRRMRAVILTRIMDEYPGAGIDDLRFLAPGAPSWRHGRRVVAGRGPRDTYG